LVRNKPPKIAAETNHAKVRRKQTAAADRLQESGARKQAHAPAHQDAREGVIPSTRASPKEPWRKLAQERNPVGPRAAAGAGKGSFGYKADSMSAADGETPYLEAGVSCLRDSHADSHRCNQSPPDATSARAPRSDGFPFSGTLYNTRGFPSPCGETKKGVCAGVAYPSPRVTHNGAGDG